MPAATSERTAQNLLRISGICAAAVQAVVYRQWINRDTPSYLDMADGVRLGDTHRLVNATWSPLYPALAGMLNAIVRPSARWEFPLIHLLNFLCFLFSFAAFEFFFRRMEQTLSDEDGAAVPRVLRIALSYSFFLWASLGMLTLMKPTPDLLMSGFVYLAAGLLLQLKTTQASWKPAALLGAVLGAGYLAKSVMFPLGLLALITLPFLGGPFRIRRTAVAAICFGFVAAPFVLAVSRLAHRPSIGEAGTVVHLLNVDGVDADFESTGLARGRFLHPVTKIGDGDPAAFAFPREQAVTDGIWYDTYYWTEGVRPVFRLGTQLLLLRGNMLIYAGLAAWLLPAIVLLTWLVFTGEPRRLWLFWPQLLLCAAALGAYATIHVELRYIGVFAALAAVSFLYSIRLPGTFPKARLRAAAAVIVLNVGLHAAVEARRDYRENRSKLELGDAEAAEALERIPVARGEMVASINPFKANGWARLAGLRIVGEVKRGGTERFWQTGDTYQQQVFDAFHGIGCKALVAWIGKRPAPAGWNRLGTSQYAVRLLR